jgi:hypothetical protein
MTHIWGPKPAAGKITEEAKYRGNQGAAAVTWVQLAPSEEHQTSFK